MGFSGKGYAPNEHVVVTKDGAVLATLTTNASGMFSTIFLPVPYVGSLATYVFRSQTSGYTQFVNINIQSQNPWITLSSYYILFGKTETVYGHGYGVNEPIHFTVDGTSVGDARSDQNGDVIFSFAIPSGSPGTKKVQANGTLIQKSAFASYKKAL